MTVQKDFLSRFLMIGDVIENLAQFCIRFFSYSIWRSSTEEIRSNIYALLAIKRRISLKVRMMKIVCLSAVSPCKTVASIYIPCSVKAYGGLRCPPNCPEKNDEFREVTICDFTISTS